MSTVIPSGYAGPAATLRAIKGMSPEQAAVAAAALNAGGATGKALLVDAPQTLTGVEKNQALANLWLTSEGGALSTVRFTDRGELELRTDTDMMVYLSAYGITNNDFTQRTWGAYTQQGVYWSGFGVNAKLGLDGIEVSDTNGNSLTGGPGWISVGNTTLNTSGIELVNNAMVVWVDVSTSTEIHHIRADSIGFFRATGITAPRPAASTTTLADVIALLTDLGFVR